ncbi:MAG TPA: class I SAM-dependent methyltransferase [Solirubrobacterales bacterium]|jgi:SAM-dependent methyltransferase
MSGFRPVDREDPAHAGQAVYTRGFLSVYDAVVYGFNSPVLWRCPKSRLVEHYDTNVSARHLDIGVGTGTLLDACCFPVSQPEITLMDLNPDSLAAASRRLARYAPRTHRANVLEDWRLAPGTYESVAMTHLLHCLPGSMAEKGITFEHAGRALAPGGTFFGVTSLGKGVHISPLARTALTLSNRRGILHNWADGPAEPDAALASVFPQRTIRIQGTVALFTAHAPG